MKKKVLFALIALFSFLSSWAADVTAGDYTVTIATQYVALTDATTGVTAPEITALKKGEVDYFAAVTKMTLVDENKNLVDKTAIKTAGKYTWVINFSDGQVVKVLKVPFYVTAPVPETKYNFIKDESSWNASFANGALKKYYTKYPQEDLYGHNDWNATDHYAGFNDRVYEFTSYADADGDTQYATGTIRTIWTNEPNLWKVKVLTNSIDGFVGNEYFIARAAEVGTTLYQLYSDALGETPTGIYVKITAGPTFPGMTQCWAGAVNATDAMYPWIAPNFESTDFEEGAPKKIVYTYEGESSVMPWGDRLFGLGVAGTQQEPADRLWGMASVAEEFENKGFLIPENAVLDKFTNSQNPDEDVRGKVEDWDGTLGANNFDITKFNMLLIPADLVLTATVDNATNLSEATVTIDCDPLPYNGAVQYPTFSGENFNATVTYTPATTGEAITLVEGRDFEAVYNAAGDDYKSADTHNFTVNFIGAYAGSKAATYDIEKAHVNINLAYIYKTYGDPDPKDPADFNFEIDASTPLKGADVKSDIAEYLVFQRASGDQNVGEDVKEYEYYYGKTADFEEKCNYSISFLQTKSLLIIQPKEVTINVTPVFKEYHKPVEFKYDAAALKAQLAKADEAKASGTPGATDLITSITWEGAGTDAGEAVNAVLRGTAPNQTVDFGNHVGYPMTATAAIVPATNKSNYNVTVANPAQGFAIVPTTTADLSVEVPATEANGAVDGKFVYNGKFQKPAPVVKDGTVTLNPETDYDVTYVNNQDAGEATCTVTLKGSYASSLTKSVNFTINRAELVVKPQSTDSEDAYTVLYETFAAREASATNPATTQETAASEYTRTTDHSYFSVNPADIKVKKGAEIETDVYRLDIELPTGVTEITAKNYTVTTGTALLALNEKPTLVVRPATNQNKVYDGKEPEEKDLKIAVFKADGSTPATEAEIAALTILGDRVYKITKEEGVNVGAYSLTVSGPTVLKDYNVEYNNAQNFEGPRNYRITHKDVTITPGNYSMVYGHSDELPAMTATVEGLVAPDDATTLGITNPDFYYVGIQNAGYDMTTGIWTLNNEAVGTRNINVTVRNRDWGQNYRTVGNYHVRANNPGTLTITKADLIITADKKTKQFGEADPEFTVTINGAKAGDDVSAYYNLVGRAEETGDKEKVGDHAIVVKKTDAGTNAANYNVSVAHGTLTISKATYYVKANDQWINYGGNINPLDVVITLPGREPLRWRKAKINETAEDKKAREDNNAEIKALGSLEVLDGKNAIGANEDAYKWVPVTGGNYTLAADKEVDGEIVKGFTNGYLTVYPLTEIPLDMENLAQVLEDHKGLKGITFIMPARAMKADEWYAWVFPFDVTPKTLFGDRMWGYGAAETLDAAKSQNGNVVFALQVAKTIKANTPFIAKIEKEEGITADQMKEIRIVNQTIPADFSYTEARPATVAEDGGVKFVGLYEDYKGPQANQLYLASTSTKPTREFYPGGPKSENVTLVQTNAYLEFPTAGAAAKARIFIEDEDGTFTAINGVAAEADAAVAGEGWYTISGVKLNAQPTEKGIYIFNGKKVAIQ